MKWTHLAAVLAASASLASTLPAQQLDATLSRAIAAYKFAQTVSVRFDQTVTNPLTGRSMSSRGVLLRKRPNLLSISFSSPASDRIVADGSALWLYLPSTAPGQVIRMGATGEQGMLIDPLGQILSRPLEEYTIASAGTGEVAGHAVHIVTLTPRSTRSLFTKATLWVDDDDGTVRQIETTEPSGLTRRVTITQFRTNVDIPRSAFQFSPPANVRVIDTGTGAAIGSE